ncbi:MAG: phosphoglucosamine mutase [Candidatus Thermoplasmatota archaeon]
MTKLFGTNGIRGIVNQDMNTDLALGIGKAWGTYLKNKLETPKIAIGTDARLSNNMLKNALSAGLNATGCNVTDLGVVPTPCLQFYVRKKDFDSGVIITASHNPPEFNGIKGVTSDGREFTKDIEEEIEQIYFNREYSLVDWEKIGKIEKVEDTVDFYLEGILKQINVKFIKKQNFHVVLDCGNGAGSIATPKLLEKLGCKIDLLNCKLDGRFPGRKSEPTPENLDGLIKTVKKINPDFGVAQDGDADRAIFVDEKGNYIWGDKTLSIAAKYIVKKDDKVVTPITTSSCFDDVVKSCGGKVIRTLVGSPTVAKVMAEENAVFGGEENGGLIFPDMQYSRDSAMAIAKILEIMAEKEKTLSELVEEIPKYEMYKTKIPCSNNKKERIMKKLVEIVDSPDILKIDRTDGIKIYFKEGWTLIRPSGTEPIIRIYSESKNSETAEKLSREYKEIAGRIIEEM